MWVTSLVSFLVTAAPSDSSTSSTQRERFSWPVRDSTYATTPKRTEFMLGCVGGRSSSCSAPTADISSSLRTPSGSFATAAGGAEASTFAILASYSAMSALAESEEKSTKAPLLVRTTPAAAAASGADDDASLLWLSGPLLLLAWLRNLASYSAIRALAESELKSTSPPPVLSMPPTHSVSSIWSAVLSPALGLKKTFSSSSSSSCLSSSALSTPPTLLRTPTWNAWVEREEAKEACLRGGEEDRPAPNDSLARGEFRLSMMLDVLRFFRSTAEGFF